MLQGGSFIYRPSESPPASVKVTSNEPLRGLRHPSFRLQPEIPWRPSAFVPRTHTLTVYVHLNVYRRYVVATSGQIIARHNVLISKKLFPRLVLVHGRGVLRSTHVLELRLPARFHDLGAN